LHFPSSGLAQWRTSRGGSIPLAPPLGVPGGALSPLENTKLKGNYV